MIFCYFSKSVREETLNDTISEHFNTLQVRIPHFFASNWKNFDTASQKKKDISATLQ